VKAFTQSAIRSVILLGLVLTLGAAAAQIGEPSAGLLDRLGDVQPASPQAQEGDGGAYVIGDSIHFELEERGGLLYSVEGETQLTEENIAHISRLIGEASGYGEGIAEPVANFLTQNGTEIAALPGGETNVRVEQFTLRLSAQGDEQPVELEFDLQLTEVPEDIFLEAAHAIGPEDASYVIREFGDFQCPACARFAQQIFPLIEEELLSRGDVRFEFHHMPLKTVHANASLAAEASECVAAVNGEEGFWTYHDALFEYQQAWGSLGDPAPYFVRLAQELDLETEGVAACLEEREYRQVVDLSYQHSTSVLGVNSTPTVYVGGFVNRNFADPEGYLDLFELVDAFSAEQ